MSEEGIKNPDEESQESGTSVSTQPIELIVNKKTGDIVFRSPDGQTVTAKATVIDEDEETVVDLPPLTPEQFRDALERFRNLGLTWSADRSVKPISKEGDNALLSAEFDQFQNEYPSLPREVNSIAFHYVTGTECPSDVVGDKETLRQKIDIAKEFYLNDEYRAEFFFKHAIKVPYFSEIDWEVVVKAYEKNVKVFTGVAYALLSLHLDSPDGSKAKKQVITVAVNTTIVDKLLATLGEVKTALESTQKIAGVLHIARERAESENTQDAHPNNATEKVG